MNILIFNLVEGSFPLLLILNFVFSLDPNFLETKRPLFPVFRLEDRSLGFRLRKFP